MAVSTDDIANWGLGVCLYGSWGWVVDSTAYLLWAYGGDDFVHDWFLSELRAADWSPLVSFLFLLPFGRMCSLLELYLSGACNGGFGLRTGWDSARSAEAWSGIGRTVLQNVPKCGGFLIRHLG